MNQIVIYESKLAGLQIMSNEIDNRQQKLQLPNCDTALTLQDLKSKIMVNLDTPHHNTRCLVCFANCHEQCYLKETKEKGADIFKSCAAFIATGNNCKCGHHYTYHVHMRGLWKEKILSVELKTSKKQDTEELIKTLQVEKTKLGKEKCETEKEISNQMQELKKICSKFNFERELFLSVQLLKMGQAYKSDNEKPAVEQTIKTLKNMLKSIFNVLEQY
jgi:hypothetical protein